MLRRFLLSALSLILALVSSAALAPSTPGKPLSVETVDPAEYELIPIQVEADKPNGVGTQNSYLIECAVRLAADETANSSGNPGILGYIQLFTCNQSNVAVDVTVSLQYQKRPENTWTTTSTEKVTLLVGRSANLFYRHNSKYDYGYWRVVFTGTAKCPNCQTTTIAGELSPDYYTWSGMFFASWNSFYTDHYEKHRNEWSPTPTQMQYLQKARSLALKAFDPDYYPSFWADTRPRDGTLIGIDTNTGEVVFVHQPFSEYPWIGSAFRHNPNLTGCTHQEYWQRLLADQGWCK